MDGSNYVGYTFNSPCSSATPWIVVVGGNIRNCYGDQNTAQNAYNGYIGASGGATSTSPLPGNTPIPPLPPIPTPTTNSGFTSFIGQNWVTLAAVGIGGVLLLKVVRGH